MEGSGNSNNDEDILEGLSISNHFKSIETKEKSTKVNPLSINETTNGIKESNTKVTNLPFKKTTQKGSRIYLLEMCSLIIPKILRI